MLTASMSVLDYASKYKEELLYNRYQAGRDQIRRYERTRRTRTSSRSSSAIRSRRWRCCAGSRSTASRVSQLDRGGHGRRHDVSGRLRGSFPMDQQFAELARQLLEVQVYPDLREYPEGPPDQPYDAAGWTLPLQMGVTVVEARTPLSADGQGGAEAARAGREDASATMSTSDAAPFDSVPGAGFDSSPLAAAIVPPAGRITGSGPAWPSIRRRTTRSARSTRAWKAGARVRVDAAGSASSSRGLPTQRRAGWSSRSRCRPSGPRRPAPSWRGRASGSISRGPPAWTTAGPQWLLENYGFEFSAVRPADVKAGALRQRFDVLIIGDENARSLLDGFQAGRRAAAVSGRHGQRRRAGARPVRQRRRHARLHERQQQLRHRAAEAAGQERRRRTCGAQQFFASGSILQVTTDPAHPLMAGMPERAAVFFDGSPVFAAARGLQRRRAGEVPGAGIAAAVRLSARREACRVRRRRSTCSTAADTSSSSASGRSGAASRSARSACCSTPRSTMARWPPAAKGTPGFWASASSAVAPMTSRRHGHRRAHDRSRRLRSRRHARRLASGSRLRRQRAGRGAGRRAGLSDSGVVKMVGEGAAVLVRRALAASGLDPDTPGALDRFLAIYDSCLLDRTRPYPGIVETLEQLAAARTARRPDQQAGARHRTDPRRPRPRALFRLRSSAATSPSAAKPDPAGLRHIIETAGRRRRRRCMVGDSPVDRQTARNAGTAHVPGALRLRLLVRRRGTCDGTETIIETPPIWSGWYETETLSFQLPASEVRFARGRNIHCRR